MFEIRQDQTQILNNIAQTKFDTQLLSHVKEYFPELAIKQKDEELLSTLKKLQDQAKGYGFSNRRETVKFINLALYLGLDFDKRDEYAWIIAWLETPDITQGSEKLEHIYDELDEQVARKEREQDIIEWFEKRNGELGPDLLSSTTEELKFFPGEENTHQGTDPLEHKQNNPVISGVSHSDERASS